MSGNPSSLNTSQFDADIEVIGDIAFRGNLYLQGRVSGNIVAPVDSSASLHLQENSEVAGEIRAPTIIVAGKVAGDIFASVRITLTASAEVTGNIHYSEIKVEQGATINGSLMALGRPDAF
ncbi:MAG: polymer-forming cytoskeletal protein [Thiofilum sp.]|uniref:bactofilin family protein n=1 Tax=Thiofilum sp. TaxID=2212733 RepID=UPI0025ECC59A|nr:polymer-forming cytoskeletal protein [Thiofilum sp.]MBK8452808.1 polymer-forming cytoskeletal protein [Thiofilum sp.]